jgi:hypothetical protein
MDPIEVALKAYRDLSPIKYLRCTHDAKVYDISYDGQTLMLASESWMATDPLDPVAGQGFRVIFSRYRATFSGIDNFQLETLDEPPGASLPTLEDFMREEIREIAIALPSVTIGTDDHEISFTCQSFGIDRLAPTRDNYR